MIGRRAAGRRPRGLPLALLLLLSVVVYGTVGFVLVQGYSWLDAVFMTVITVTTVGYEEVHPLDAHGEILAISLIVLGVGAFLYTFGTIVEQLSSGRWSAYRRERRVDDQLRRLRDHVIVCGYGRTGAQVVRELDAAHVRHVVIEMNDRPLQAVERDGRLCVVGDAAGDELLMRAGIDRARALVSAVDSDERNVYIVLTARSLNPRLFIVARSSYPDSEPKLRRAGADRVVSPYTISGNRMAALALQPAVVDVLDLVLAEGGVISVEELEVPEGLTTTVRAGDLGRTGATVLAVRAAGGALSVGPSGEAALAPGALVVAMGTREQLRAAATLLQPPSG